MHLPVTVLFLTSGAGGGTRLSIKELSFWNRARVRTISLEKSLVPYVPSRMCCTNGDQSRSQTFRKLTTSRAAPLPRESQTAPQNRPQSQWLSSSVSICRTGSIFTTTVESKISSGDLDTIVSASARLYGVKCIWGTPVRWRKRGRGAVTISMTESCGILPISIIACERSMPELTISPSRAIACSRVGGASLCRSIPSYTSMNFFKPSTMRCNWTTSALKFSHLPSMSLKGPAPAFSAASLQASTVRSSKCLPVTHSLELIIAWSTAIPRTASWTLKVFPVALVPWTTIVDGVGMSGWIPSVAVRDGTLLTHVDYLSKLL